MAHLDWIFVAFGAAITLPELDTIHPQRIFPRREEPWPLDSGALAQLRQLGACFVFMGVFFALQMTTDLTGLPWWSATCAD